MARHFARTRRRGVDQSTASGYPGRNAAGKHGGAVAMDAWKLLDMKGSRGDEEGASSLSGKSCGMYCSVVSALPSKMAICA